MMQANVFEHPGLGYDNEPTTQFGQEIDAEDDKPPPLPAKPKTASSMLANVANEDTGLWMAFSLGVSVAIGLLFYCVLHSPWDMPWYVFLTFGKHHIHKHANVTGAINEVSFTGIPLTMSSRLEVGWNIGSSAALIVDGDEQVNVAGGGKWDAEGNDYDIHTLQVMFSSGKTLETVGMALLHDRGLIDIREPVAKYWPEFAQHDKHDITIEDILSHRSGLGLGFSGDAPPTLDTLRHHDLRAKYLAEQTPLYHPKVKNEMLYSGWFAAMYLDEICRRVDPAGRSLLHLLKEDVIAYLPNAELYAGGHIPDDVRDRISPVHEMPYVYWFLGFLPQVVLPDWLTSSLFTDDSKMTLNRQEKFMIRSMRAHEPPFHNLTVPFMHAYDGLDDFNNFDTFLSVELLSVNAISNSHTMALVIENFAHNGMVHDDTLSLFTERMPSAWDPFLDMNVTVTRGGLAVLSTLFPEHAFSNELHTKTCIGWAGLLVGGGGGSLTATCTAEEHNVTFSYTSNRLSGRFHDWRSTELLDLAVTAVRHKKYKDFTHDIHKYFAEFDETGSYKDHGEEYHENTF